MALVEKHDIVTICRTS